MSLDERAYAEVANFIRCGGFAEGDRLPPERALAAKLGMTRSRVRLALARLETEGAVWRHIGKGTFVGAGRRESTDRTTHAAAFTSPREVMEARLALEPSLARLAAFRATAEDFERLDACLARGSSPDDVRAFRRWDMKLHQALTQAAGNALLNGVFRYIHSDRNRYLWGRLGDSALEEGKGRIKRYVQQHRAIVEAIRERDPDAAERAMRDHLETVRHHLFAGF
jgi:DNA-binding FadR family transcriptional regulator